MQNLRIFASLVCRVAEMVQGCGGQSKAILGILCSALLSVAFHQSRVRPGPKWLRWSHFFQNWSLWLQLGFDHVSHSQAAVLLLSLISATHAGLLGAGHLIFMMLVLMMKTIMKRTTSNGVDDENDELWTTQMLTALANDNDNNDANDYNDYNK